MDFYRTSYCNLRDEVVTGAWLRVGYYGPYRFHCRPYHHPWLCSLAIYLSGPRRTVISWTEICTIKCCANSVCTSSSGLRYIKEVGTDFPVQRSFRLSVIRFARWTNRSWHRRSRCCIVDTEVTNQPWTIGFHSELFSGGINRQRGWFVVSLCGYSCNNNHSSWLENSSGVVIHVPQMIIWVSY